MCIHKYTFLYTHAHTHRHRHMYTHTCSQTQLMVFSTTNTSFSVYHPGYGTTINTPAPLPLQWFRIGSYLFFICSCVLQFVAIFFKPRSLYIFRQLWSLSLPLGSQGYFQTSCVCPGPVIAAASQGPQITRGCLLRCLKCESHSSYSQSTTRSQNRRLWRPCG